MTTRPLGQPDDDTVEQVHQVVAAVVELGGAVGWLRPPSLAEIEQWLQGWCQIAATGRGQLLLSSVDGSIRALGGWRAGQPGPVGHVVELSKVMVHPDARGGGLGLIVVEALIEDARQFGAELLVLGVRGNNHGALALYERCGFAVWATLPNGVAVGEHRFDDVRLYRQLSLPATAIVHGTSAGGLGGSRPGVDRQR
ncbi:MAG: GNAT family N-acetyltransferase [Jatrophihabitantaceae bacterium]